MCRKYSYLGGRWAIITFYIFSLKVGNRLKSVWWRNSAIYVAHCTNMKACWGRWKNRIFQSTLIICTLYHIQYLVIVLKTREYIGEIINRSGNERREKPYFSFLVMSSLIPLISERYGRPLTKLLSQENKINLYFHH